MSIMTEAEISTDDMMETNIETPYHFAHLGSHDRRRHERHGR